MKKTGIIDVHTHQPSPFNQLKINAEQSARLLLGQMDGHGVAFSGILGRVRPGQSEEEMRESIAFTDAVVRCAPDRLYGMVYMNPSMPEEVISELLDRHLQTPYFRGIKLELDLNCRDPRMELLMEKAIAYDVPVLHHSWYLNLWESSEDTRRKQAQRSEPHDVAALARRFPKARIIMAHMEGCGVRGILDIAELPNVWIDTSGSQPFTGTLEYAVEMLGSHRILFGSDLMGRSLEGQLGRIYGSYISDDDLEKILFRNAREVFKISGEQLL